MNIPPLPIPTHPSHSILDSTKLQTYQDCPRLFFFEYLLGWRPSRPNNHLLFGQAVHLALEHIQLNGYRVEVVMEALEIFNTTYRDVFPEDTDSLYTPKTPGRFMDMLILYIQKYSTDEAKYELYKTEFGGTIHLSPSHVLAFKMDTILRDRSSGNYFSLEHKTKGGNYIDKSYHIDHLMGTQVGTYTHVLNSLFPPENVSGVIINCMCFKKTKQPSYLLERFPVFLSNQQMYIWLESTKSWMDLLEHDLHRLAEETDSDPVLKSFPMCGRSCSKWGRICQFQDLCSSWPNPLQHLNHRPLDLEISFWNPLEEPNLTEVMEL